MAFYRLILILVHFFLAVKHCLLNGVELLWKLALPLFVRNSKSNSTKHARILQDSKHLSKLPDHISFVIVEKDIRFMDLAQMIVWSMAMGISYISIYDREGHVKRNAALLSREVIAKQEEIFEEGRKNTFIIRTKSTRFDTCLAPTQVCISLFSCEDGTQDIVQAAREFCVTVERREKQVKELEPDTVDSLLKATKGIPDPDLALKFGSSNMLMGFLPWQCRLTEILSHRTHHNVEYSLFLSSLRQFCKCDQRFGK